MVEALGGLIQYQKVRLFHQRARQQHPLKLPTREVRHLTLCQIGQARLMQGLGRVRGAMAARQVEKALHGHWQGRVDMQLLRNIADAQAGGAGDMAG